MSTKMKSSTRIGIAKVVVLDKGTKDERTLRIKVGQKAAVEFMPGMIPVTAENNFYIAAGAYPNINVTSKRMYFRDVSDKAIQVEMPNEGTIAKGNLFFHHVKRLIYDNGTKKSPQKTSRVPKSYNPN